MLDLEGGGGWRKGLQGRRDSASKGTEAGECRRGGRWDHSERWAWAENVGLAEPGIGTQAGVAWGYGLAALCVPERSGEAPGECYTQHIQEFPGCSGLGSATVFA